MLDLNRRIAYYWRMMTDKIKHPDSEIIDRLGGATKTAKIFGIKRPSVCEWRWNGIPKARRMYLELARPDLFGLPAKKKAKRGSK